MGSIVDHLKTALIFLDPDNEIKNISEARSEIRNALSHYYTEKEIEKKSVNHNSEE